MSDEKAPAGWRSVVGGGAEVRLDGTTIHISWVGPSGYAQSVRRTSDAGFDHGDTPIADRKAAKDAAVELARKVLLAERARIDRVLLELDRIRDEPVEEPAKRRGRR